MTVKKIDYHRLERAKELRSHILRSDITCVYYATVKNGCNDMTAFQDGREELSFENIDEYF